MDTDGADVILNPAELSGLTQVLGGEDGRLNLLPRPEDAHGEREGSEATWVGLPAAAETTLRWALSTLKAPTKVMALHTSLADEVLTRQTFAWPAGNDTDLAVLNPGAAEGGTATWRVGRRSPFAVRAMVRDTVAVDAGLPVETFNVSLPTQGVVAFLAIIDHLRYARRYAELIYEPPVVSFTLNDILARLEDAEIDDFRWPLLFFEKLTPPGALATYHEDAMSVGLQALLDAELVECLTEDADPVSDADFEANADFRSDPDHRYRLLPEGDAIADTFLHEVSKVGFTVSQCLPGTLAPDGQVGVGQDIGLLVRGAVRLVLAWVSGRVGTFAFIDAEGLTELLDATLEAPPDDAVAASQASVPAVMKADEISPSRFCSQCGGRLEPTSRFCSQCGAPVQT